MRNFMIVLAATVTLTWLITGCQKTVPTSTADNIMMAVVDSNSFNAIGTNVMAVRNYNQLVITGVADKNVKIIIYVNNFVGFDESVKFDNYSALATLDSVGIVSGNILDSGYVNFTEVYPYLKGSFAFRAADNTVVSHGSFYCVAPTP